MRILTLAFFLMATIATAQTKDEKTSTIQEYLSLDDIQMEKVVANDSIVAILFKATKDSVNQKNLKTIFTHWAKNKDTAKDLADLVELANMKGSITFDKEEMKDLLLPSFDTLEEINFYSESLKRMLFQNISVEVNNKPVNANVEVENSNGEKIEQTKPAPFSEIGTWTYVSRPNDKVEFKIDGTGSFTADNEVKTFKYEITRELCIEKEGLGEPIILSISFDDGKTGCYALVVALPDAFCFMDLSNNKMHVLR